MQRRRGIDGAGAWLAVAVLGLVACAGSADVSAESDDPNAANPMRWVTYARQPMAERRAAVQRMLTEDADAFWADCATNTRQIDDWPMIRLLAAKAASTGDARAMPWLVRSWAMRSVTVADDDRPEREAIASITGEPATQLLKASVFEAEANDDPATQVAAWSVLVRVETDEELRRLLAGSSDDTPILLVSMLKRFVPALDVLPGDRVAVAQMMVLSVAYDDGQVDAWASFRASQQGKGPAVLGLRHLPAITHRDTTRDAWTRQQWLGHIHKRLAGRRHASRGDGVPDDAVISKRPDRFGDHIEQLGIADLIVLDQLLDAMANPRFVRVAFELAEADRLDTTTEFGGALMWGKRGEVTLQPFDPLLRRHDQAYLASTPCMEAVYLGLAHVHLHAQCYDNAAWAGPGKGDLDFADSQHANGVVLTYLDRNTLNVDAYFPGNIIIDLGCVTR